MGENGRTVDILTLKQVSFPYFSNNIANKIVVKRIFCYIAIDIAIAKIL